MVECGVVGGEKRGGDRTEENPGTAKGEVPTLPDFPTLGSKLA